MKLAYGMGIVAVVLLAACSGDAERGSTTEGALTSPHPAQGDKQGTTTQSESHSELVDPRTGGFDVGFGEFAVTPEAKTIRPGRVTFVVRNGGRLTHGFELESENEDKGSEGSDDSSGHGSGDGSDDRFKIETETFGPSDTVRVNAKLVPGTYKIYCYVADHEERGMRTLLTVRKDAPLVNAATASADSVEIKGFAFVPNVIEVKAGTTVRWTNADPTGHTVTARDQSFGSDPLAPKATFAVRFRNAGAFRYFGAIHPAMEGTVKVT